MDRFSTLVVDYIDFSETSLHGYTLLIPKQKNIMDESQLPDFVKSQLDEYIENENSESSDSDEEGENELVISGKTMKEKLKNAAPYNLFFNTLKVIPESGEDPNCINFTDLLCPSLGQLKCSLQMTTMVNTDWLIKQYKARGLEEKPLTIIYGMGQFQEDKIQELKENHPNVTHYFYTERNEWCGHHSKVGIYLYEDNSMRIVVSTANLYEREWNKYNHLIWMSPLCPQLPSTSKENAGESPTGFKNALLNYLKHYNLEILQPWLDHVKNTDFSSVRVFLVSSIPGTRPLNIPCGHRHVERLLTRHCELPERGALLWPIVAQTSSLGVLGTSADGWLKDILKTLSAHRQIRPNSRLNPALKVIFPSVRNVLGSSFGPEGALCLYMNKHHVKQTWLHSYLHQWKADGCARSTVIPHQRSYCRVSPCNKKMAWFLMTSANLTGSAWGFEASNRRVHVKNHEVGVLFIPRFFDEEFFEIDQVEKNERLFPFMYDLPLMKYEEDDYPWNDEARFYYEEQVGGNLSEED